MPAIYGILRIVLITSLLLSAPASGAGWTALFDGQTFNGWTTQNGDPVTEAAWHIADGMIHLDTSAGRGGNLITDRDYADFELLFEWKISEGGNNGIKYRVKDYDGRVLGCEYQLIDDERNKNLRPTQMTASLYDVYEPRVYDDLLKPAGEFNRGRIVVCGSRIEHWLNGYLVVAATVGSPEWAARIADSKFSDAEGFGANRLGRIMLTDHGDDVWFRNIYLRPLSADPQLASHTTVGTAAVVVSHTSKGSWQNCRRRPVTIGNLFCRRRN